uniref:Uncharacterized protein n=1 Tax=Stomoxys calcitrans TaxID=35570 RepID=A0A1I8P2G5_STOCA
MMNTKPSEKLYANSRITRHPQAVEHQRIHMTRSQTKLLKKNPSELSLTPSQAEQEAKANVNNRKNPLDALSKTNVRLTTMERRSGLQEVNEEYLKQNFMLKPLHQGNSPHNESHQPPKMVSNQPQMQQQQQIYSKPKQINHHQQQQPPPVTAVTNQIPTQMALSQTSGIAGGTMMGEGDKPNINQTPMEEDHSQPQQSQSHQSHMAHQQQQSNSMISTPGQRMPEPELCTTCPNCQTTIYLVPAQALPSNNAAPN